MKTKQEARNERKYNCKSKRIHSLKGCQLDMTYRRDFPLDSLKNGSI